MLEQIITTIGNTVKPVYIKNYDNFKPGVDTVLYSGPYWDRREIEAAVSAFLTGKWLTSGEYVDQFQFEFAKKFNVKQSHMVNSGSSANLVMFTALKKYFKWQDNDELIVSPVGFPTTIAPIIQNNLKPVFIDIEMDTLNFDIDLIESAITSKTRAIVVSPVLGNPPDMDKLKAICDQYNLLLIGDSCDSLGTRYNGAHLTDYYFSWTCSFFPAHHISTGEGGMVSSNDTDFINLVRSVSWWGRDCRCSGAANLLACGTCGNRFDRWLEDYDGIIDHKYVFTNIGYNLKPLDFQGAIGSIQLTKVDEIDAKRKYHKAEIEKALLENIPTVRSAAMLPNADTSWFGVPLICSSQDEKELLVSHFEAHKIQTRSYFAGNILIHSAFKHLDDYRKYPNSNLALSHVFFLGCTPQYNEKVLDYIKDIIKKW
jgi:CDP-6-deoxy-D-xylo-4-hexulose-3-dehydrase